MALAALALASVMPLGQAGQAGPLHEALQARRDAGAASQAAPASPTAQAGNPQAGDRAARRPLRAAALPPGVRVQRDLAYGPHPLQRMDVYLPPAGASAGGAAPLIVMAHGGGWRRGDKAMAGVTQDKVARWVTAGAMLVSLNYRVLPEADPLQQAVDVATAIATAQQRAPGWGADPRRTVLMGHSAGAHLMALVASSTAVRAQAGLPLQPWLGAVLLDSATLDVPMTLQDRQTRGRRGAGPLGRLYDDAFGGDPSRWRAVSPWHQLDAAPPPVLIVCAASRADACGQARHYAAKVQSLGGQASVLPVALSHGEINAQLGRPGAYTDAVEAFLRRIGALR